MSRGASLQLPDLIALTRSFELQTNPHCREVSDAVEAWWQDPRNRPYIAPNDVEFLHGVKAGLLAALILPACDSPQLTVVADFLTALQIFHHHLIGATCLVDCGWQEDDGFNKEDGVYPSLATNKFFQPVIPRLVRFTSHASTEWHARFSSSSSAFRSSVQLLISDPKTFPPVQSSDDTEVYIQLKSDASGFRMVFDLLEIAKELHLTSDCFEQSDAMLESLVRQTLCILTWSHDIASYNLYQSHDNQKNAISIISRTKDLTTPGALKVAYAQLKLQFERFKVIEQAILGGLASLDLPQHSLPSSIQSNHSPSRPTSATSSHSKWSWPTTSFLSKLSSADPDIPSPVFKPSVDEQTCDDIRTYIQGLRDCIVGYIHWTYETEIFFGKHGEEVRNTGWMFLLPGRKE